MFLYSKPSLSVNKRIERIVQDLDLSLMAWILIHTSITIFSSFLDDDCMAAIVTSGAETADVMVIYLTSVFYLVNMRSRKCIDQRWSIPQFTIFLIC